MAEGEVAALKEALYYQYIIMKQLCAELEEEREASATATSEALSMILRLQREKAVEKMEACQYKRMVEEKMYHAEECLAILEDVTQQKEMEIASLQYQLEAYKQKILSLGINIPDVEEMRIIENRSFSGRNALLDKTSFHGFVRRNLSLPSLRCDQLCSEMDINNDDSPLLARKRSIWRKINEKYDESGMLDFLDESAIEGASSDWKQAEEVNKKMKELMQAKNAQEVGSGSSVASNELQRPPSIGSVSSEQESGSCSWYSAVSGGTSCDATTGGTGRKSDTEAVLCLPSEAGDPENVLEFDAHSSSCSEAESTGNAVHSAGVHGIFEVPESHKGCSTGEPCMQVLEESIQETKNMVGMPNLMQEESMEYLFRDENKVFMNEHPGSKLSTPRNGSFLHHGSKLSTPRKGTSVNYLWTLVDSKVGIGTSQIDFAQLELRLRQLEDERIEIHEDSERGKEQLKLLREIFKQLNTIETHIKNSTSKKSSAQDDSKVVSVMEAVLSFSI